MERTLTLLSLIVMTTAAHGQTLDNTNAVPPVGYNAVINSSTYAPPGNPGPMQTWNFANLTTTASNTVNHVTPASTGYISSFPSATVATSDPSGVFGFFQYTSQGGYLLGYHSTAANVTIPYQNSEQIMKCPCSFNTTWTDNSSSSFTTSGIPASRSGTSTGIADGYGTLVMPYGTVSNVLRVKFTQDYSDDLGAFGVLEYDAETYQWWKPGTGVYLLVVSTLDVVSNGVPSTQQFTSWLNGGPVGLGEGDDPSIGIDLFPNPAAGRTTLRFGSIGGPVQLRLFDHTGRAVLEQSLKAGMGITDHELDLGGLPAGFYQVQLTARDGSTGVKRLVVE
ncbi:MAG: T9SS type A sorting domain-containing protein [Flavobacteriales bacterium]|nr:T9SS type A sorting domain-containing protein [Flavobacteriales bacterium]